MMYVRKASRMAALSLPALLATPLHASVYPLPADGSPVVGTDTSMQTVYEDTLPDLAHRYSLGYYEIIRANPGVDVWLPGAGTKLLLPGRRILPAGPRTGLVVNLPEHRLYYYPKPRKGEQPVVITYPVSIGKMDWRTPLGDTRVIAKIKHPAWYPPESIRKEHAANGDPLPKVVGAGPDNPLGDFALRLAAGNGEYMIHGTNNPTAVGMAVTHGCIRMYPRMSPRSLRSFRSGPPCGSSTSRSRSPGWTVSCCSKRTRRSTKKGRASSRTCSCCRRCWTRRSAATPPPSIGTWRAPRSSLRAACPLWSGSRPSPTRRPHPHRRRRRARRRRADYPRRSACAKRR